MRISPASVPSSILSPANCEDYLPPSTATTSTYRHPRSTNRKMSRGFCVFFCFFLGGLGGLLGAAVGVVNGYITWYNYGKNLRKLGHGAPTTRFLQATSSWNYTPK